MGRCGSLDIRGLKKFQEQLNKLQDPDAFAEACAKELAARLLAKVIKRTPVGDYDRYWTDTDGTRLVDEKGKEIVLHKSSKKGGTLRRGWTSQKGKGSEGLKTRGAAQYVETLPIHHFGDTYVIEIINPVEYASYVEFGHRTPNHKGWVRGRFMMTISEQELQQIAPKVLETKIKKYLEECFK